MHYYPRVDFSPGLLLHPVRGHNTGNLAFPDRYPDRPLGHDQSILHRLHPEGVGEFVAGGAVIRGGPGQGEVPALVVTILRPGYDILPGDLTALFP